MEVQGGKRDSKGHIVAVAAGSEYVYNMRCFAARRLRDSNWIYTKPCVHHDRDPIVEGQEVVVQGHMSPTACSVCKATPVKVCEVWIDLLGYYRVPQGVLWE